jgi:hypothetical protein
VLPISSYPDPYNNLQPLPERPRLETKASTSSTGSARGFGGIFHFSHSADPSKAAPTPAVGDIRGGAHRGTKDYPHLSKKEKAVEREERRGLVVDTDKGYEEDGDLGGRASYEEEEPRSAVTEESLGHIMSAQRMPLGGRDEGEGEARSFGGVRGPRAPGGR